MIIPGLKDEDQIRFDQCYCEILDTLDSYFPEIRVSREDFESRVFMTLYLELINAGFFKR